MFAIDSEREISLIECLFLPLCNTATMCIELLFNVFNNWKSALVSVTFRNQQNYTTHSLWNIEIKISLFLLHFFCLLFEYYVCFSFFLHLLFI